MPDFPAYTRDELEDRARNMIRMVLPSADVADGSDYDLWARVLAMLAFGVQSHASVLLRQIDPTKAFGSVLREHTRAFGVGATLVETSADAIAATGKVILRSSTGSQSQAMGSALTHADGTAYTLDSAANTPATAVIVARSGWRSTLTRVFQGFASGGAFVTLAEGQVYEFDRTGEYCAIHGVDDGTMSDRPFFDLHTELEELPQVQDTFTQVFGVVAAVTCSTAGRVGNKDPRDTLTITTPSGTVIAATQVLSLSGGRDALLPAEMQGAIRELIGTRLGAMSLSQVLSLVLESPGRAVSDATILPAAQAFTIYPCESGFPFITSARATEITSYVQARVSPIDNVNASTCTFRLDDALAVEVVVAAQYAPDWRMPEDVEALFVDTGSTTTRIEYVTPTGYYDVAIGDRVIVTGRMGVAPYATFIVQRTVTAVTSTYLDVSEALPFPPTAVVSFVTPGGPLGQRVIDAIVEHYDSQRAGYGTAYAYPQPDRSSSVDALLARVSDVTGVLDCAVEANSPIASAAGEIAVLPPLKIKMWSV